MMKCTELLKKDNKSLVEVRDMDTNSIQKYVVCVDFDNSKAYGNKWSTSKTFMIYDQNTEYMLEKAVKYLYGIDETSISFERLEKFAKGFLKELQENEDDDDIADMLKSFDITEDEAEFFDVKDIAFPKLYKIVNVTFRRTQYATVAVVMPDDEDVWSADEYVENKEYLDDLPDMDADDWEYDDYGIEREGMTKEEFNARYSNDEVWNADDIDDI